MEQVHPPGLQAVHPGVVLGVRRAEHDHDRRERGGDRAVYDGVHDVHDLRFGSNAEVNRAIRCEGTARNWRMDCGALLTSAKPFSGSVGRSWYSPVIALPPVPSRVDQHVAIGMATERSATTRLNPAERTHM